MKNVIRIMNILKILGQIFRTKICERYGFAKLDERRWILDQWFFLPKLKMAKKVKSKKNQNHLCPLILYIGSRKQEINDDIFRYEGHEIVNQNNCAVISSTPIKDSNYKSKKIFVDDKIFRVRKVEYFSENLTLEKTLFFKDIVKSGEYWLPKILEMKRPNGNYTIMNVKAFKPDIDLDDAVFSESFLINN